MLAFIVERMPANGDLIEVRNQGPGGARLSSGTSARLAAPLKRPLPRSGEPDWACALFTKRYVRRVTGAILPQRSEALRPANPYCTLTLAALMMGHHFSISAL